MKFQYVINMERISPDQSMEKIISDNLELVQMADRGGVEIVWAAEHHTIEMTVAPNPFMILTWYAAQTQRIRLGTATVVAPYWHPIKTAGEAALCDLYSGGRLEFGIGSGAYQYEFDRMHPGLKQNEGYRYVQEMLPAVKALWQGDYAHDGEIWSFPTATSVPKPLQKPHPPIWVAARAPITFDFAISNGCNVITWALTRPFDEVELYMQRFEESLAKHPDIPRPIFATMRHSAICGDESEVTLALECAFERLARFENLFRNLGDVANGFPADVDVREFEDRQNFDRQSLRDNLMFGTTDEVIEKLKRYEALGVDHFVYNASYGLPIEFQKKSLQRLIDQVMPAFA